MFDKKGCIDCGAFILKTAPFCPFCGSKQARPMSEEDAKKDPFKILQVSPEAEVITAAYRGLARKYHPDSSQTKYDSERIRDINWAYSVLKDPIKRRQWAESQRASSRHSRETPYSSAQTYSSKPRSRSTSQSQARSQPQTKTTYKKVSSQGKRPSTLTLIIILGVIVAGVSYLSSNINQTQDGGVSPPNPTPNKAVDSAGCGFSDVERWLTIATDRNDESNKDMESWNESSAILFFQLLANKSGARYSEAKNQQTPVCLETLRRIDMNFYTYETRFYDSIADGNVGQVEANGNRLEELTEEYNNELDRVLKQYGWD